MKSSLKWSTIERLTIQITQFVLGIVIARIVSPNEYGILGIIMVFVAVSEVFVDSGLGSSLIYKNDLDEDDLQTTFTFNFSISFLFFGAIYFGAPLIEQFYELDKLSTYLRIGCSVLIANSLVVVPTSIFKIRLDFKSLAIANILSTCLSGMLGLFMALGGYGIWALVGQLLSKSFIQCFLLLFQSKWIPKFKFKKQSFLSLYSYGINIFGTSIITKISDEGIAFFIAKAISPYSLGIFTRGTQFANLPSSCIGSIINNVIFPTLSSLKERKNEFNQLLTKAIEYQSALTIPMYMFFAVLSKPIILLLLTEKWADVIPVLQILCIGRIVGIVVNTSEQTIMALGYSNLFLKQQTWKIGAKILFVIIALPFGLIYIAIADALSTLLKFFITTSYLGKVSNYGFKEQLKAISPFTISSIISAIIGFICIDCIPNIYAQLMIALILMVCIYCFLLKKIFNNNTPVILIKKILKR